MKSQRQINIEKNHKYQADPEWREKIKDSVKRYEQNLKRKVFTHYSKGILKCKCCYEDEFKFPPYPNTLEIMEGYKYQFLTCTVADTNEDVTNQINQLLGPKFNFYKDIGRQLNTNFFTDGNIVCLDNDLNDIVD